MPGNSQKFHTAGEGSFRFGEFDLYPSERRLCRSGKDVALSPKVFDALLLFVQHAERLVRREHLIEA
jgi:DNA-binding winged helix-turn-helix (wHTH) protein